MLAIIATLKVIDSSKLKGYVFAIFNKGFVEKELEEEVSFFNTFYTLLFVFSTTVFSLIIALFVSQESEKFNESFSSFTLVLGAAFCYFLIKRLLEIVITRLFLIKNSVRFYLISKFSSLYSVSFLLFILYILIVFSRLNTSFLFYTAGFLFFVRFLFQVGNNKKLIFSKLFYFILYICAFEIAPLFILFKLML